MIRWIEVARCAPAVLPDEGELTVVYNGRELWMSRWKQVLADSRLKGRVTHFADGGIADLELPYPPSMVSNTMIDETRATEARRNLRKRQ